ncbi:MAG: hypothetical protein ACMZI0_09675 [Symbiopectobacterium sp.]|uniref:hypothetical protein n=1 Tax=Symbiopectobacterium sp. TaxID=2952789 RepID=UPI0039ED84BA
MACMHLQRSCLSHGQVRLVFAGIMALMVTWSGAVFANATLIAVKASAIRPTQPAIGKAEVAYTISRAIAKNRARYLMIFVKEKGLGKWLISLTYRPLPHP